MVDIKQHGGDGYFIYHQAGLHSVINLAGITYLTQTKRCKLLSDDIQVSDRVYIRSHSPYVLDGDYEVIHEASDMGIGYIPKLITLKKYMGVGVKENNRRKHDKQLIRYNITKKIREQIVLNATHNEIQTYGEIADLLYKDGEDFNRDKKGEICSVSVRL
tara:strand:- start:86 stop:565 length:480 start_codon:yes stop_codon:yes gene_type:complete